MIYAVSLRFPLLCYNCPYSSIFLILHSIAFHSTYNLVDSSHHVVYKESLSPCGIQSILVTAPKYCDTSYFLVKKVQLLLSKLSASEFYFTSNNLMFVRWSYRFYVVSTSSSCVVTMWDVLFTLNIFCAINHGDERKSLVMFYYVYSFSLLRVLSSTMSQSA